VALVRVVDLRRRCAAQPRPHPQRPDPADAQQQLLLQPVLAAAAVQAVGDPARQLVVLRHVGVEHQERDATDVGLPDRRVQHPATGQVDAHPDGRAVRLAEHAQRQTVRVDERVGLDLPAVPRQRLVEVPGAVHQADTDDRDAEVGGALQVVAGQDAEATGVLRQHRGDAELRGEVGHRVRQVRHVTVGATGAALVPQRRGQVLVQVVGRGLHARDEARCLRPARPAGPDPAHRAVRPGPRGPPPTAAG